MKALTIRQPFASALVEGLKHYETRSKPIKYRGELAIHVAKETEKWKERRQIADMMHFLEVANLTHDERQRWKKYHMSWMDDGLPYGAVIATCQVTDCISTDDDDFLDKLGPLEIAFGDYSWGRFAWKLEQVRPLIEPVPTTGQQGLWNWDGEAHYD